jgi:hypothetical protein
LPDICLGILFEFFPLPPGCFHVQGKQEVTWRRGAQVPSTKLLVAISPN